MFEIIISKWDKTLIIDTYSYFLLIRQLGTQIIHRPDQDANDLNKSIQVYYEDEFLPLQTQSSSSLGTTTEKSPTTVIIVGAFGGRFDQEMASINSLFRWNEIFDRLILLDEASTTFLLEPEKLHRLYFHRSPEMFEEGDDIGLIPIGGKVHSIETTGLKWNLHGQSMEFGKLVSTSNRLDENSREVTVFASDPLLWTNTYKAIS
jgi:thiamine pyrophosphokinase